MGRSTNGHHASLSKSAASPIWASTWHEPLHADVYSRRDQFALDWSGGFPPEPLFRDDEFTKGEDRTGNSLYNTGHWSWNLDWWRWRVARVRKIFTSLDRHVLGSTASAAVAAGPQSEMLPLSFDQMRERTSGTFPVCITDDSNRNCGANRQGGNTWPVVEESRDTRGVAARSGTVPDLSARVCVR
jgi:4-alpha-glucanotransferase